ncbi:MAG: hypothetical protein PHH95_08390, partial [Bacteroidales bacterium]|nr:hypothetical protein [Bacteroidales bacterium]
MTFFAATGRRASPRGRRWWGNQNGKAPGPADKKRHLRNAQVPFSPWAQLDLNQRPPDYES